MTLPTTLPTPCPPQPLSSMADGGASPRLQEHTGPRRRVALYSHDTQGLGHIRRNIALASALVAAHPATDVLLITGAPEATTLPLPPNTDVLTLPTLHKDVTGRYSARVLSLPLTDVLRLRSIMIEATLQAFAPELLIVDKAVRGVHGELDATLASLHGSGTTRIVLGLRDVLDDPATTRREWAAAQMSQAVLDWYDAVWVYGDPEVYDLVAEYAVPAGVAAKVAYTGFLANGRGDGATARSPSASPALPPSDPYVLCLVGGGQDGAALADAFVRAELPAGHRGVVLTGPYMSRAVRASLAETAAAHGGAAVLDFVTDADRFMAGAAAVVSMGGYNSVCELLAARRRTLVVPRVRPRTEQLIRARRLERRGLVDVLEPAAADPVRLSRWLAGAVSAGSPAGGHVDLDGLRRVPALARQLLRSGAREELFHVAS